MATAIRDLFVSVTTKVDASGLATLDKKLDGAKDKFGKFAAFLAGGFIAKGVATFIKGQLDFADHLQDTSTKLGIATDDLERFGFVAQLSGSSAEEMYSSLNKMNKAIGDNSAAFGKLGISLKNSDGSAKSTKDVFTEVTENFGNLKTQGEKTTVAMDLFGKSGTNLIPVLTAGSDALKETFDQFEALGGATPTEFLNAASEMNDELDKFELATLGAKQTLVSLLLPALSKAVRYMSEAVAKTVNFEKRTKLLSTGIKVLASMFAMLKLASLAGNLVKVGRAAFALKNIFGGFKSALMTGGLFLAALIIQDLITFATGGKSAIGDFLNALIGPEEAGAFAKQLLDTWTQVKDTLTSALPGVLSTLTGALPSLIQGFLTFADVVSRIISLLWNVGKAILEIPATVTTAWHLIKDGKLTAEDDAAQTRRNKIEDSLANVFDTNNFGGIGGTKAVSFAVPQVPSVPGGGAVSPSLSAQGWGAAPAAAAPNQSVSQINNNTITINASDPKGVGDVMRTALPDNAKKQLRDAKGALASKGAK